MIHSLIMQLKLQARTQKDALNFCNAHSCHLHSLICGFSRMYWQIDCGGTTNNLSRIRLKVLALISTKDVFVLFGITIFESYFLCQNGL